MATVDYDDDILDPELLAKQRRLLVKITKGSMQKAFLGWKNLCMSLKSKKDVEARLADYKAILDTAPFNRTKEDIKVLTRLVKDVPFFASLPEQVRYNASQQLRAVPLHAAELTFTEKDYRALSVEAAANVVAISDTFYTADHALFLEDDAPSNPNSRPVSKEGERNTAPSESSLFRQESMASTLTKAEKSEGDPEGRSADLRSEASYSASATGSAAATSIHEDFLLEMEENELSVRDMKAMLKNSTTTHVQYVVLKEGQTFSGRHLDIRNFEKEFSGYSPPKILAVCSMENRSAMLLKLPQEDLLAAIKGRTQAAVHHRVDFCCRIPVFRWSPFKELHQLATNVTEKVFEPGANIVTQGKESTHIHVILQGEVGIFVDLTEKANNKDKQSLMSRIDAFKDMILSKHNIQHALLAMRGPGAIIGDDCLRDRYMAVSAIAKTKVKSMMITMQKFKLCIDILTLNRMSNFRPQFTDREQELLREHIRQANFHDQETANHRHSLLQSTLGKEHMVVRPPLPAVKAWKPNGGRGGGKGIQSFEGIVDLDAINPKRGNGNAKGNRKMLDLDHFGLLAAANSLGLSSPSMGKFLASVKDQVAKEQLEIKKKQEMDKKDTLGFAVPEEQKANVMNEQWIDCRDFMEEKAQGQRYTEMMETAVILVIDLKLMPGQGTVDLKQYCRACDEARIRWGASAAGKGLQLTRWSTSRWFLCSSLGDAGLKHRPVVRELADCALEMQSEWHKIMREQRLLFHTFAAGLVVGPAFVTYDGGKFLSGVSGRAFDTALELLDQARKVDPCSCIMATDACVEALRHTHSLYLEGTNYRLAEAMKMPFEYTPGTLIGKEVDFDPVSPGPSAGSAAARPHGRPMSPPSLLRAGASPKDTWVPVTPKKAPGTGNKTLIATQSPKGPATPKAWTGRGPGRKSNLSISVPSPGAGSHSSGHSLIGYGPDAIVTPGNFGKPLHLEANHITQPSTAGQLVAQKSHKSLKKALESDMPLTPGGTVLAPWDSPVNQNPGRVTNETARGPAGALKGAASQRRPRHRPGPVLKAGEASKSGNANAVGLAAETSFGSSNMKTPVAPLNSVRHSNFSTRAPPSSAPHHKLPETSRQRHRNQEATQRGRALKTASNSEGYKPHPIHGQTVRNQARKLTARQVVREVMGTSSTPPASPINIFGSSAPLPPSQTSELLDDGMAQERSRAGYSNLTVVLSPLVSTPSPTGGSLNKTPVKSHAPANLSPLRHSPGMEAAQSALRPGADAGDVLEMANEMPAPTLKHTNSTRSRVMFEFEDDDDDDDESAEPDIQDADNDPGLDYSGAHVSLTVEPVNGTGDGPDGADGEANGHLALLTQEDSLPDSIGSKDGAGNPQHGVKAAKTKQLRESERMLDTLRVSKDCGSLLGAQHYVSSMAPGTMVLIMSVAGQAELPDIGHLGYLEMLAASYNRLVSLPDSRMWSGLAKLQNLVLSHNEITSLPSYIFSYLPQLQEVNLGANRLQELPSSLWSLANLQVLCLSRNQLTEIPPGVSKLVSLQKLFIGYNALTQVPDELATLTQLSVLDLGHNQIQQLPADIGNLSRLVSLNLMSNQLSSLPSSMMSGMPYMERLNLGANLFRELWEEETQARYMDLLRDLESKLPAGHGANKVEFPDHKGEEETPRDWMGSVASYASSESENTRETKATESFIMGMKPLQILLGIATAEDPYIFFPRLKVLNLSHNKLKNIPEWISPKLQELYLSYNRIAKLPEWVPARLWISLRVLDLHHNGLAEIPKSFFMFKQLDMFGLNDNPMVAPAIDAFSAEFLKGAGAMDLVKMKRATPVSKLRGISMMMCSTIGLNKALQARREQAEDSK